MGPVRKTQSRELLGLFVCVCIALCTIVAHNIAWNRPDNFPSYPPDNHHCYDDVYLREGGGDRYDIRPVPTHATNPHWFCSGSSGGRTLRRNRPTQVHLEKSRWNQPLLLPLYLFNGLFSRTTWVSWHQKGKPFWILLEQEMMEWQWHQLDHMQIICTLLQTDNHASKSPLSFYRPDALHATNQQRQTSS